MLSARLETEEKAEPVAWPERLSWAVGGHV